MRIIDYVYKMPLVRRLYLKSKELETRIINTEYENSILARENIDLRLKLKKMNGEKINVLFVCHRPQVWESLHSVYDALNGNDNFEVSVVAIPNKKQIPGKGLDHEYYESEDAEEFWKEYGCINGYDYEKGQWIDLRELAPDYVFFQQPYNITRPKEYSSSIVSKYAKLVYVSYFAPSDLDEIYDECAPMDYLKDLTFFFTQHKDDQAHILERYRAFGPYITKVIETGFPRYDRVFEYAKDQCDIWCKEDTFKILWTPRWTTNENNCFFFAYKDKLIEYCVQHSDTELTFRPHPQAFKEWRSTGELPDDERERYLDHYKRANLHIDDSKNYFPTMFSSDCLITDKSSMFIDYFMTGKPIIYCRNEQKGCDIIPRLREGVYEVYSWDELTEMLERLRSGDDPLSVKRSEIASIYLRKTNGTAAERIRDILLEDALK